MTEEQIDMLRHLIRQEIDAAQIDGMEHGAWGWADKQLDEGWQTFVDSFKFSISTTPGSDLLDAFHNRAINSEQQALKALDKLYQENDNGMKELADD